MSLPDHFTFKLTSRQMKDLEGAMLFDRGKHADSLTEYPVIRRFKTGHASALENRPPCGGCWVEESS
jgi:hypothetical protein